MSSGKVCDFKVGTGDELKRIGTARRRAASSCNAFAIATFSSCVYVGKADSLLLLRPTFALASLPWKEARST